MTADDGITGIFGRVCLYFLVWSDPVRASIEGAIPSWGCKTLLNLFGEMIFIIDKSGVTLAQ